MRNKIVSLIIAGFVAGGFAAANVADAKPIDSTVKVGRDNCGNLNVWVNGEPLWYNVWCGPDPR